MSAFAEVTLLSHGHGGPGWELGSCLWSPATTSSGQDRYAIMREPEPGDRVYHWVAGVEPSHPRARFLWGRSLTASTYIESSREPPNAGEWAGRAAYYRIDLRSFEKLTTPIPMSEVEDGIADLILSEVGDNRTKHYPYVRYQDDFRIAQGIYLTRLSPGLAEAMEEAFASEGRGEPAANAVGRIVAYDEGERTKRETTFFRRNPQLRRDAVTKYGFVCVVCGFDFEAVYGPLGAEFIEMHHLRPLAERIDIAAGRPTLTTVEDVVPLCSNCHRMIHRRRPALTLDELRAARGSLAR